MSFLELLPQISIPSMEARGVDDPAVARRFADRLNSRLSEMQRAPQDDEQLDGIAFLPSGAAVKVNAVDYQSPARMTLRGQEQVWGKHVRCWSINLRYGFWSPLRRFRLATDQT